MRELKTKHVIDVYEAYAKTGDDDAAQVYIKAEADKVIADLEESHKKEVGQLLILNREQANASNRLRDSMEQALRHHKHKRCLAMARWCDEVMMSCELRGYAVHRIWANKHQWAMRWKYKWLEIAEKFKEAK